MAIRLNATKILIAIFLIHIFAFILTACGSGSNNAIQNACISYDGAGHCVTGNNLVGANVNFQDYPYIQNGRITNTGLFRTMMYTDFPRYTGFQWLKDYCVSLGGADCHGLQIMISAISGMNYNIALRGLAVNQGIDFYAGDNNYLQNTMAQTVTFYSVAQPHQVNGTTTVRFQQQTMNNNNPYQSAYYERSMNHLYLETDGPLSNTSVNVTLYYNGGGGGSFGAATPVATATLVKGRDYP